MGQRRPYQEGIELRAADIVVIFTDRGKRYSGPQVHSSAGQRVSCRTPGY